MRFEKDADRMGSGCVKWLVGEGELPMWIADMDFPSAPAVVKALTARARHGVYGYHSVPDELYDAYIAWWERRYAFRMRREWLQFATGVVPAVTCAVKRFTNPGDNVVLLTPVYNIFFHSVENTGRHTLECPLRYQNGVYEVDYRDLERKLSHPLSTMLILCNPHNPIGKIWTKEELAAIGELAKKHGVLVLSDEVHCDLTRPRTRYTPFASLSEETAQNSITCLSASKSFNLGGLQSAVVCVPDPVKRNNLVRGLNSDELAEPNCFAVDGTIAAFTKGQRWLESLRAHLFANRDFAEELLKEEPELTLVRGDATYLLWIDCSPRVTDSERFSEFLREKTGLCVSAGSAFRGNGASFVRLNAACSKARLKDGIERLIRGYKEYKIH